MRSFPFEIRNGAKAIISVQLPSLSGYTKRNWTEMIAFALRIHETQNRKVSAHQAVQHFALIADLVDRLVVWRGIEIRRASPVDKSYFVDGVGRSHKTVCLDFANGRKYTGHFLVVGISRLGQDLIAQKIGRTGIDLVRSVPAKQGLRIRRSWVGGFRQIDSHSLHVDEDQVAIGMSPVLEDRIRRLARFVNDLHQGPIPDAFARMERVGLPVPDDFDRSTRKVRDL